MRTVILDQFHPGIKHLVKKDQQISKLVNQIGTIRYQLYDDPYSFLIHEIIEQMLSIKSGNIIYERLKDICNGTVTPDRISLLTDEDLRSTGMSYRKVKAIIDLTNAIITERISLSDLKYYSDEDVIGSLVTFNGIGNWTAKMFLIFVLDRQNVLPYEDGAFLQVFRWLYKTENISVANIKRICQPWTPYSSLAARYMYRALDQGLTKSSK